VSKEARMPSPGRLLRERWSIALNLGNGFVHNIIILMW